MVKAAQKWKWHRQVIPAPTLTQLRILDVYPHQEAVPWLAARQNR
jgi:hypothetical protein